MRLGTVLLPVARILLPSLITLATHRTLLFLLVQFLQRRHHVTMLDIVLVPNPEQPVPGIDFFASLAEKKVERLLSVSNPMVFPHIATIHH